MTVNLRPPFTWKLLKTIRHRAGGQIVSARGISSIGAVVLGGAGRFATSPLRDLPDFVVIGAQKAGSTSLHYYLAQHERITMGVSRKEQHFFDTHYHRGVLWYRTDFPIRQLRKSHRNGSRTLIGEGTPSYMFHPLVPKRMAELLPKAKIIALLRNPVDRAISHYFHNVRHGYEDLPMDEAFAKESERLAGEREKMMQDEEYKSISYLRYSYLSRGRYAEQLEQWLQYYPREQLLLVSSEDLFAVPQQTVDRVFSFLGREPCRVNAERRYNQYGNPEVESAIRDWLAEYFRPQNARLSQFGFEPDWDHDVA